MNPFRSGLTLCAFEHLRTFLCTGQAAEGAVLHPSTAVVLSILTKGHNADFLNA